MTAPNLPGGPAFAARWAAVRAAWEHPLLRGAEYDYALGRPLWWRACRILVAAMDAHLGIPEPLGRAIVDAATGTTGLLEHVSWDAFAAVLAPHVAARVESEGGGEWETCSSCHDEHPGHGWEPVSLANDGANLCILWRRRLPVQP